MHPPTITRRRTAEPALRSADAEHFATLYARHHDELARYCRSILRHDEDVEDVEDALQSTMTKAFAALQTETREIALRPWLFRIAHNEAISIVRRRVDAAELDDRDGGDPDVVPQAVETRERLRLLREDLRDLPERQRSALVLRELSGLSHREISDVLGTSPSAVKQAIYEARCGLGDCAAGRSLTCDRVRRELSDGDGRTAGRRGLRAHLRSCRPCRAFDAALRQRPQDLGALLPAGPVLGGGLAASLSGLVSGAGGGAAVGTGAATVGAGAVGSGGLLGSGLAAAGVAKIAGIAAVAAVAGGGAVAVERGTFASSGSAPETSTVVREAGAVSPSVLRFAVTTDGSTALPVVSPLPGTGGSAAATDADSPARGNGGNNPAGGHAAPSGGRPAGRGPSGPGAEKAAVPSRTSDRSARGLGRDRGNGNGDRRATNGRPAHAASGPIAREAPRGSQATGAGTRRSGAKGSGATTPPGSATGSASPTGSSTSGQATAAASANGSGRPSHAASTPDVAPAATPATGASGAATASSGSASADGPRPD